MPVPMAPTLVPALLPAPPVWLLPHRHHLYVKLRCTVDQSHSSVDQNQPILSH